MTAPAAVQVPRRVPPALAVALSELMIRKDRYRAYPGVLAVFAPYLIDQPKPPDEYPTRIDIECIRRLGDFLAMAQALDLLPQIIRIATPFLHDPTVRTGSPLDEHNPAGLTDRELQVLVEMADGRRNAEIGMLLHVAEDTVKTFARRLFRKLAARDRAHAVRRGYDLGYLHTPDHTAERAT